VSHPDKEMIDRTLDALERLMRMFQVERLVYLGAVVASFALLLYAGFLMFNDNGVGAGEMSLIFGATGLSAFSSGRIIFFLNKAFNLIEDLVRKLSGLEARRD